MKRVVLFGNSTWCIYNFRLNLMSRLVEEGCDVHVLAPLDPTYSNDTFVREFRKLGVTFHELPLQPRGLNPLNEVRSILTLYRTLRRLRPDVLLSFTVKCNLYGGFCRQLIGFEQAANVPGLGEVFERRGLLSFVVSCLYRLAFRGMSKAFFQNKEDLRYCRDRNLVRMGDCSVIPGSGVDLRRFTPAYPPRSRSRRVFLMFGRLLPQKGYRQFVDAARELRSTCGDQVECWVMGIEDKNRPESTELLQMLREAEAEGAIKLLPAAVDVRPILAEVDTVVLPSRYNEGIPRSLLEALASGKVIITTDWRGCRETVRDRENGILIDVNNTGELVKAMQRIASLPEHAIRAMGEKSRMLVEERFDEQVVLDEYLRFALGYIPADSRRARRTANDSAEFRGDLQHRELPREERLIREPADEARWSAGVAPHPALASLHASLESSATATPSFLTSITETSFKGSGKPS